MRALLGTADAGGFMTVLAIFLLAPSGAVGQERGPACSLPRARFQHTEASLMSRADRFYARADSLIMSSAHDLGLAQELKNDTQILAEAAVVTVGGANCRGEVVGDDHWRLRLKSNLVELSRTLAASDARSVELDSLQMVIRNSCSPTPDTDSITPLARVVVCGIWMQMVPIHRAMITQATRSQQRTAYLQARQEYFRIRDAARDERMPEAGVALFGTAYREDVWGLGAAARVDALGFKLPIRIQVLLPSEGSRGIEVSAGVMARQIAVLPGIYRDFDGTDYAVSGTALYFTPWKLAFGLTFSSAFGTGIHFGFGLPEPLSRLVGPRP